jgi:phosphoglycerate dehydrogenase-like enzyme
VQVSETRKRLRLFITSPLEEEHVERLRHVRPEHVEVVYHADLMPPTRYVADHNGPPDFTRSPAQLERWRAELARADALLDFPSAASLDRPFLDAAPNVKWVQTTSAGVGQAVVRMGRVDTDLLVTTASGVHARPLAEFVFMALLTHVKLLPRLQRDQQRHVWERFCSDELDGKTMALIGPGRIGQQIAAIGRCFGMRVLATGRSGGPERAAQLGVDRYYARDDMHEMLGQADVVVLSCPHTPETDRLIDEAAFAAMRPGVLFVNVARGQVVVEPALLAALRSGKIAFAALDVFEREPLAPDSPFWDLPNVLINPHSASTAYSENRKITDICSHNLACYVDGRLGEMRNVLDKQRMY